VLGRPQVQLLVGAGSASIRVIVLEVFSPVLLLLLCVCFGCWVFVCVFSVFSLFLVLCDLVSVKRCLIASRIVCKLLLLNEIRAQARSRKKKVGAREFHDGMIRAHFFYFFLSFWT